MLNPILFLPFVITPIVMALVASGLQAATGTVMVIQTAWTLPFFLGAYFSSGADVWAIIISLITFAISVVMWAPFVIAYDRKLIRDEGYTVKEMNAIIKREKRDKREKKMASIQNAKKLKDKTFNKENTVSKFVDVKNSDLVYNMRYSYNNNKYIKADKKYQKSKAIALAA